MIWDVGHYVIYFTYGLYELYLYERPFAIILPLFVMALVIGIGKNGLQYEATHSAFQALIIVDIVTKILIGWRHPMYNYYLVCILASGVGIWATSRDMLHSAELLRNIAIGILIISFYLLT